MPCRDGGGHDEKVMMMMMMISMIQIVLYVLYCECIMYCTHTCTVQIIPPAPAEPGPGILLSSKVCMYDQPENQIDIGAESWQDGNGRSTRKIGNTSRLSKDRLVRAKTCCLSGVLGKYQDLATAKTRLVPERRPQSIVARGGWAFNLQAEAAQNVMRKPLDVKCLAMCEQPVYICLIFSPWSLSSWDGLVALTVGRRKMRVAGNASQQPVM